MCHLFCLIQYISFQDKKRKYHSHKYTNGTLCDLTNKPRQVEVRVSQKKLFKFPISPYILFPRYFLKFALHVIYFRKCPQVNRKNVMSQILLPILLCIIVCKNSLSEFMNVWFLYKRTFKGRGFIHKIENCN